MLTCHDDVTCSKLIWEICAVTFVWPCAVLLVELILSAENIFALKSYDWFQVLRHLGYFVIALLSLPSRSLCRIVSLCILTPVNSSSFLYRLLDCQAITAGYFYHTARLSKSGQYRTVKHQQVMLWSLQLLFYVSFVFLQFSVDSNAIRTIRAMEMEIYPSLD